MTDPANPVELAQALIRCKSVTPDEGGALTLIGKLLGDAGFRTHLETFSEPGADDVSNLYARIGTTEPVLVLAGHTDVVPPGASDLWTLPPFAGEIRDGVLYGRGAVDMKGGVAAMVAAALRYLAEGNGTTRGSIAFLLTGDEEGAAVNGTAKLLEWTRAKGEKFDHCLLAEPSSRERTGDEIKIGRRGSLSGIVTIHGKQGHVAYPHNADNPLKRLMPVMTALLQPVDYGTASFERSNLEITSVDTGNETVNVIPAKVAVRFNIRFGDAHTLDSLKTLITERVERAANGTRYDLSFLPNPSSSFLTSPGPFLDLVTAAVQDETGEKPKLSTGGGTSDARFIKDFCPVIELGPVNATMHQVDERIALADLEAVSRIYQNVLTRYFDTYAKLPDEEPAAIVAAAAALPEPALPEPEEVTEPESSVPELEIEEPETAESETAESETAEAEEVEPETLEPETDAPEAEEAGAEEVEAGTADTSSGDEPDALERDDDDAARPDDVHMAESEADDTPEPPPHAISIEADLEAALEAELNLGGTEAREDMELAKFEDALRQADDAPDERENEREKSHLDSAEELIDSVIDTDKV